VSVAIAPVLLRVITPVIERLGLATYGVIT
jgi:hypothetical protein